MDSTMTGWAPIDSWPVIASDPGWEMRQGPSLTVALPDGSIAIAEAVWTSDTGLTGSCSIDGKPMHLLADFDLAAARIHSELFRTLEALLARLAPLAA